VDKRFVIGVNLMSRNEGARGFAKALLQLDQHNQKVNLQTLPDRMLEEFRNELESMKEEGEEVTEAIQSLIDLTEVELKTR
jgi:formiminotetrahydrofolate cyclodeaminase